MKTKYIIPLMAIVCFFSTSELIAQTNYVSPSRELVESLLQRLDLCKDVQTGLEDSINYMENNPESFTLQQYNDAKNWSKDAKTCINGLRKKLDALRKDYPGWFNSPSASIGVHLKPRRTVTPRELQDAFDEIASKIGKALARLEAIHVPED